MEGNTDDDVLEFIDDQLAKEQAGIGQEKNEELKFDDSKYFPINI